MCSIVEILCGIKGKFGLVFGNSCIMCMLQNIQIKPYCEFLFFLSNSVHLLGNLTILSSKWHLKEVYALRTCIYLFKYELFGFLQHSKNKCFTFFCNKHGGKFRERSI